MPFNVYTKQIHPTFLQTLAEKLLQTRLLLSRLTTRVTRVRGILKPQIGVMSHKPVIHCRGRRDAVNSDLIPLYILGRTMMKTRIQESTVL